MTLCRTVEGPRQCSMKACLAWSLSSYGKRPLKTTGEEEDKASLAADNAAPSRGRSGMEGKWSKEFQLTEPVSATALVGCDARPCSSRRERRTVVEAFSDGVGVGDGGGDGDG